MTSKRAEINAFVARGLRGGLDADDSLALCELLDLYLFEIDENVVAALSDCEELGSGGIVDDVLPALTGAILSIRDA